MSGLDCNLAVQVIGRDSIGEPDAILREVELEAMGLHEAGCHFQDDGFTMFPPDFMGAANIGAELNVLAGHFGKALTLDGVHEARAGAVIKELGWRLRSELDVDFDRVTLGGPDALSIVRETITLVALLDDGLEGVRREVFPILPETGEEIVNFGPALGIESEANGGWIVAEDQAEESADLLFVLGHGELLEFESLREEFRRLKATRRGVSCRS